MKKIFYIIFYSGVVLVLITFMPSLIMPRSICIFGGKLLGYWSQFCVKFFLSTTIQVIGKENILKNETKTVSKRGNTFIVRFPPAFLQLY